MTKQSRTADGLGRFGEPGHLVLLSLAGGPRHGHAILADIAEQFGITLGPGTLYGSITKLADLGLIVALDEDDRRRPYDITDTGRAALAAHLETQGAMVRLGAARLAGA